MPPLVSVLMPVYNRAKYLPIAVDSVLAQTFPDFELILSDNRSTDDSPKVAQAYAAQDQRVKYAQNTVHVSAVENFNHCFARSDPQSTYFALLASDDWWEPTFLARLVELGERETAATFLYTDMYRVDEQGQILNRYSDLYAEVTPPPGLHRAVKELYRGNYINIMAALIRRAKKTALYPEPPLLEPQLKLAPDYNLWVQLLTRGAFGYYLAEPLASYRRHTDSMTSVVANNVPRLLEEILIFGPQLAKVCPPELEEARQAALRQRYAQLGILLLETGQAAEAQAPLAEAQRLGEGRHLDAAVAQCIAALPLPTQARKLLWQGTLSLARFLGRVK